MLKHSGVNGVPQKDCETVHKTPGCSKVQENCEFFKVMRVVGEGEIQIVERASHPVLTCAQPAKKVIDVSVEMSDSTDSLFRNKVVKEGVFHVQILYVGCDDLVRHASFEVPFINEVDIPGARPGMHVQNEVLHVEQKTTIVTQTPQDKLICQVFDVRIVARVLIRVAETVVRKLVECRTQTDCHPSRGHFSMLFRRC